MSAVGQAAAPAEMAALHLRREVRIFRAAVSIARRKAEDAIVKRSPDGLEVAAAMFREIAFKLQVAATLLRGKRKRSRRGS